MEMSWKRTILDAKLLLSEENSPKLNQIYITDYGIKIISESVFSIRLMLIPTPIVEYRKVREVKRKRASKGRKTEPKAQTNDQPMEEIVLNQIFDSHSPSALKFRLRIISS